MFWDLFIERVFASLGGVQPWGLESVGSIFVEMHRLRLVDPSALDDRSILLLIASCRPGTELRAAANQEFDRRRLHALPGMAANQLEGAARRRLTPLLAMYHHGTYTQRGLACDLIMAEEGPRLATFLARLYMDDPATRHDLAVQSVAHNLGWFGRIPPGTLDFTCYLYHHVLATLPSDPAPPSRFPTVPLPHWAGHLSATERRFLSSSGRFLSIEDRIALCMVLYGQLTVGEIRIVQSCMRKWRLEQVIGQIEEGFRQTLRGLPLVVA